jgi:surface-anchored protein
VIRRFPSLLVLGALALPAPAAAAQGDAAAPRDDAALEQRIDREQAVARDRAVLADGHVDVGPRFLDGRWTLMIHDDAARSGGGRSVWRPAERTVLRVGDAARRQAPDDPAYRFLRAEPGTDLWVVPQTQDPEVVWVGWNTQDPQVMERIDRGVTMTLLDVQGPGSLIVYLQSGDFAHPDVLWDSEGRPRPAWVDVNTHTHANWVFSAPGAYLARVRIEADLIDGTTVSDTRELRFAVGSAAAVEEAFAARWRWAAAGAEAGAADAGAAAEADAGAGSAGEQDGGGSAALIAVIAVVAAALAVALALALVRGAGAKRRARAGAAGDGRAGDTGGPADGPGARR